MAGGDRSGAESMYLSVHSNLTVKAHRKEGALNFPFHILCKLNYLSFVNQILKALSLRPL